MNGICFLFNDSPWIFFEPGIAGFNGEIKTDGYSCPADKKQSAGRRTGFRYPDFYISQGKPLDNVNGLLLGEIKAGVSTFYHTWIHRSPGSTHFRPEQFEVFARHTRQHVPSRLMVLVAFNDGPDTMKAALAGKMIREAVAGFIIALD